MNFQQLKRRVERGETLVEGRFLQTRESHERMNREWREAWTPLRIVVAGLVAGFVMGRAEPEKALKQLGKFGSPRTLQLVGSMAGLVGSIQAAIAAMTAKSAAETADGAAETAEEAAQTAAEADAGTAPGAAAPAGMHTAGPATGPQPRTDRRQPEPPWDHQPSPAEAATELSER
ncbi:protein sip-5 [Luteimonas sp. A478]